jgi:hypothetical protein
MDNYRFSFKSKAASCYPNQRVVFITITILYIIHRLVIYLQHNSSETGFCLRLQVEAPQLGPIVGALQRQ